MVSNTYAPTMFNLVVMKKLVFINEPTSRYFKIVSDGRLFDFVCFDSKVDVERGEYLTIADSGYKTCAMPTLNELVNRGDVVECVPYKEYDVYVDDIANFDADKVVEEFRVNGFEVERVAVMHNFEAWCDDYKSGYRGAYCHLFSPCGCNRLRFSATTLHKSCEDWQITYVA